jgi:serine/threonine-protein kinase HipA
MDIAGEARRITRAHLLELAAKGGIKPAAAVRSLERILDQVAAFGPCLGDHPIRRTTIRTILQAVEANVAALGIMIGD